MMYFVYVLYSIKFDRKYVGLSSDCKNRLAQHNSGKTKSTKAFRPWTLVHVEEFDSRFEARKREKYLKSGAGREWSKENINWPRSSTE